MFSRFLHYFEYLYKHYIILSSKCNYFCQNFRNFLFYCRGASLSSKKECMTAHRAVMHSCRPQGATLCKVRTLKYTSFTGCRLLIACNSSPRFLFAENLLDFPDIGGLCTSHQGNSDHGADMTHVAFVLPSGCFLKSFGFAA